MPIGIASTLRSLLLFASFYGFDGCLCLCKAEIQRLRGTVSAVFSDNDDSQASHYDPIVFDHGQVGLVKYPPAVDHSGALFNAFAVFLLRQFIRGIPKELEEAAVMDGASIPRIYWSVILPLIKPALAAMTIFIFMGTYNNFMDALIYLSTPEKFTVPLLLNNFKGLYVTNWSYMMAGATISVIPIILVYLFAQRYIIEGITLTGIKG